MKKVKSVTGEYFYGHKISAYGLQNGFVDYYTLSQAFDMVLNNSIMAELEGKGYYFELVNGYDTYYEDEDGNTLTEEEKDEKVEALEEKLEDEDLSDEDREELERQIYDLEQEHYYEGDIYQYFIVSERGYKVLTDYTDEFVWYCEKLDLCIWGVTHLGTSWDYVLTNIPCIPCNKELKNK